MEVFNTPTSAFNPALQGHFAILEDSGNISAADTDGERGRNDVSRDGLLFTEALRTAQATPDIRQDKVNAIRARIANGTYEVDSRLIAAGLIRDELGF